MKNYTDAFFHRDTILFCVLDDLSRFSLQKLFSTTHVIDFCVYFFCDSDEEFIQKIKLDNY